MPPLLLSVLGLVFGIFPVLVSESLVASAASASLNTSLVADLHLWHGLTPSLLLSGLTLVGGILFFYGRKLGRGLDNWLMLHTEYRMESVYNNVLENMLKLAGWQIDLLQNGYLRHYILWVVSTMIALGSLALVLFVDLSAIRITIHHICTYEILIVVVILLVAVFAVRSKSVLGSVASLGITGYGIALLFVFYGAPDLALTQFSIETLTVILHVLVVYKIPRFANYSSKNTKRRDAAISIAIGSFITIILLVLMSADQPESISQYFLDNSYLLAHGRNVVNVILVDFRALDTMGEITVLAIAAVGVISLHKLRLGKDKKVKLSMKSKEK